MWYDAAFMLAGLLLVAKGGDFFVDSSVVIGRALHVPRFVIGGTLVSMATTTPELVVSVLASTVGDSGIALGNAVGSVICNIGLIVGTVAMMVPVTVDRRDFTERAVWMSVGAVLVILFSWDRLLDRSLSALLLALAGVYVYWDYREIRKRHARGQGERVEPVDTAQLKRAVALFALGGTLILFGSRLLVTSGQGLAEALGVPSIIIGLTLVAVGTSLPEFVTGVTAARKGIPDLSLGNIIGANVLNLLGIVGTSGTIHALTVSGFTQWYSYPWMLVICGAVIVMVRRHGVVRRRGGLALLTLYALYVAGLVLLPPLLGIEG